MMREIELRNAIGRTFSNYIRSGVHDEIALIFDDSDTTGEVAFARIASEAGFDDWDSGEINPLPSNPFDWHRWNLAELVGAGIMTEAEIRAARQKEARKLDADIERRERAELARLRAKYPEGA